MSEVLNVMRTTGSPRYYDLERDVPDEVLMTALEAARFGPSGGNRQPVRWIIVRDPEIRQKLADLYLPLWQRDMKMFLGGEMRTGSSLGPAVKAANDFAESFAKIPVLLVACVVDADMHAHMKDADGNPNFIGGSSVYPFVQNACLALRDAGVGSTITTLICEREAEAAELLGLPDGMRCACHITVGYPANGFPTALKRMELDELVSFDRFSAA